MYWRVALHGCPRYTARYTEGIYRRKEVERSAELCLTRSLSKTIQRPIQLRIVCNSSIGNGTHKKWYINYGERWNVLSENGKDSVSIEDNPLQLFQTDCFTWNLKERKQNEQSNRRTWTKREQYKERSIYFSDNEDQAARSRYVRHVQHAPLE